jgi:excisionase family DNA binding protein
MHTACTQRCTQNTRRKEDRGVWGWTPTPDRPDTEVPVVALARLTGRNETGENGQRRRDPHSPWLKPPCSWQFRGLEKNRDGSARSAHRPDSSNLVSIEQLGGPGKHHRATSHLLSRIDNGHSIAQIPRSRPVGYRKTTSSPCIRWDEANRHTGHVNPRSVVSLGNSAERCWTRTLVHETHVSSSPVPELPRLLNLKEAAQLLAVSRRTLEREISAGNFPRPLKIGRSARVAENDLRAYIAKLQGAALNPLAP